MIITTTRSDDVITASDGKRSFAVTVSGDLHEAEAHAAAAENWLRNVRLFGSVQLNPLRGPLGRERTFYTIATDANRKIRGRMA